MSRVWGLPQVSPGIGLQMVEADGAVGHGQGVSSSCLGKLGGVFTDNPITQGTKLCFCGLSHGTSLFPCRVGRNVFTRKRTPKGKILHSLSPSCEDATLPVL